MQSNSTIPESRAARSFLFVFLFVLAFAFVFPFVAERAPILRDLAQSYSTHALDYAYTASGVDADIVFFGDSTALYGPDVTELSHVLGMKAINLPETITTLAVTRDLGLERYLEHNKAPKLIVLHFAPWNLDALANTNAKDSFEGEEQVVRHGSTHDLIQLTRTQPLDMLRFPFRFYLLPSRLNLLWNHRYVHQEVTQGHVVMSEAFGSETADCRFPDKFLKSTEAASMEPFMNKLRARGIKVMLYLAPLPACANLSEAQGMPHGTLQFERSIVLPPNTFAKDGFFVHPLKISSAARTQAMAESIRKALAQ